ncbi:hypothetical protein ACFFX0_07350 [Citricoccus parietis]|uniref:Uncharacterized protein n=1 Tax=Citricoccus parietis TaxID=592307 RepID=A0ABV5FWG3_9MICC
MARPFSMSWLRFRVKLRVVPVRAAISGVTARCSTGSSSLDRPRNFSW